MTSDEQEQTTLPMTEELVEQFISNSTKKQRKKLLKDKSLVAKNNDYELYKSLTKTLAEQFDNADSLVQESKTLLAEVPNEEMASLTESLENDLNKIRQEVNYVTTVFNGTKSKGTRNFKQRLKVLQMAETAENLSGKLLNSILPTALELGTKIVEHGSKVEEVIQNES